MKSTFTLLLFACIAVAIASPQWKRVAYTKSTIFNGIVTSNNGTIQDGDLVGLFINGECRMVAPVQNDGVESYVSGVLHSESTERAEIKYWNSAEEKVYDIDTIVTTIPDGEVMRFPIHLKSETVVSSIESSAFESQISAYPSPFNSILNINSATPMQSISIISQDGRIIDSESLKGATFASFETSQIPAGKYAITVQFSSGKVTSEEVVKK